MAINAAPENGAHLPHSCQARRLSGTIYRAEGKNHIEFIGEDLTNTVLTYGLNVREPNTNTDLRFRGTGVIVLGRIFMRTISPFKIRPATMARRWPCAWMAIARFSINCRILGWQDTVMVNIGRDYFTKCYIAGRVDFIYGSAAVVFNRCEIHSKNGGHVTAANTPQGPSLTAWCL